MDYVATGATFQLKKAIKSVGTAGILRLSMSLVISKKYGQRRTNGRKELYVNDKLRKKIVKRIADGLNEYRPKGKPIEEIADRIIDDMGKAGYIYAPPIYHKTKEVLGEVGNLYDVPIASINGDENIGTGREWYERFEKEFDRIAIYPDPNPLDVVKTFGVHEAAKRASRVGE